MDFKCDINSFPHDQNEILLETMEKIKIVPGITIVNESNLTLLMKLYQNYEIKNGNNSKFACSRGARFSETLLDSKVYVFPLILSPFRILSHTQSNNELTETLQILLNSHTKRLPTKN